MASLKLKPGVITGDGLKELFAYCKTAQAALPAVNVIGSHSANAALAAADAGKFLQFHDALFANQPQEGKRGYDKAQLIELGKNVGITDSAFAQTVNAGTYDQQLNSAFQQISDDPKLQQDFGGGQRGFGTPTVTANGSIVSWQDPDWLKKVIG